MATENVSKSVNTRAQTAGVGHDGFTAAPEFAAASNVSITVNEDGSVNLDVGGAEKPKPKRSTGFDANLAEDIEPGKLGSIGFEVTTGVAADIDSRAGWIANYSEGVELLGTTIQRAGKAARGAKGTISNVKHPALLTACTKYQASAYAELLPSDGPVKTEVIGDTSQAEDILANDYQSDFNHYLTYVDEEYYQDTKQGFFMQAFSGNMFKKVFWDPVRRRPVSQTVPLTKLIVSEEARSLQTAHRVTHEIDMMPAEIRRMQLAGVWRDIQLGGDGTGSENSATIKEKVSQGLAGNSSGRPQDRTRTIWECYLDIDPAEYGIDEPGAPERLPLPYRVTVDKETLTVLEIRRNWREGDSEYKKRQWFVKYGFVSGLGFLDYGFVHLIGNQTRVMTGCLQILVDAGMFKSFPGGVKAKGVRISTNEILPGLGEFVDVDIGAMKSISDAIMLFPYAEPSAVLFQLLQHMEQNAGDLAGAVDMETGEGRTNVPVGTIMSQIEQQTQIMGAIHKGNHKSQSQELKLLHDLFMEHPEDLVRLARDPRRIWQVAEEFADVNIVPKSDPNIPAQMHRLMIATALVQLMQQDAMAPPSVLDRRAILGRVFHMMGLNDGDSLFAPPPPPQAPQAPPVDPAKMMAAQANMQKAQTAQFKAGNDAQMAQQKAQLDQQEQQRQAATTLQEGEQRQSDRLAELQMERMRIEQQMNELHAQGQQHNDGIMAGHLTTLHDAAHQQQQASMNQQLGLNQSPGVQSSGNGFATGGAVLKRDAGVHKPWLDPRWTQGTI